MREVQISTFKTQCLSLLDEINQTKEELTVTRHGKPLVVINAVEDCQPIKEVEAAKVTVEIIVEDNFEAATDLVEWEVF